MHVYMCVCVCVCTYIYTCAHIAYMCACVCVCATESYSRSCPRGEHTPLKEQNCIHTYIHTYIHTQTQHASTQKNVQGANLHTHILIHMQPPKNPGPVMPASFALLRAVQGAKLYTHILTYANTHTCSHLKNQGPSCLRVTPSCVLLRVQN